VTFGAMSRKLVSKLKEIAHLGFHMLRRQLLFSVLEGGGLDRTATSSNGWYEFSGLTTGAYRVSVVSPDGYSTSLPGRQVDIRDLRGCAEENYTFSPAGRIAGRVVRRGGRGLAGVQVEVTTPEARPMPCMVCQS
jgi:hypothetical protein